MTLLFDDTLALFVMRKLYAAKHQGPQHRGRAWLSGIAADTMGFAARYGGEEFCLLLPNVDAVRAREIGKTVRAAAPDLEPSLRHRLGRRRLDPP